MMGKIKSLLSVLLFAGFLVTGCSGHGSGSPAPPVHVPGPPVNLAAAAHDGYVALSWGAVNGATFYNLYWSTTSGVTNTNGTQIYGVHTPLNHGGLVNGTTYFYVVTAVNSAGESTISSQA